MIKKYKPIVAGCCLAALSSSAMAYFDVKDAPKQAPVVSRPMMASTSSLYPLGVTQVGMGKVSGTVQGRVIDTALQAALPLFIPSGWRVKSSAHIRQRHVSWTGGSSWLSVLDGLTKKSGLSAVVNWRDHVISIYGQQEKTQLTSKASKSITSKPRAAVKKNVIWHVKRGEGLNIVMTRWASRSHWQFISETKVNYTLMADADFMAPTLQGAVTQLLGALNQSGRMHLNAKLYRKNHVLKLSGK